MTRVHEEITAGRFPNCRKIAAEFETSTKTIQRDIDFMRDRLSLPIAYDSKRFGFYYEAKPQHSVPPRPFVWSGSVLFSQ